MLLPTDRPVVRFRFPVRRRTGFDRFFDEQAAEMTPDMVALCRRVYDEQQRFCRMAVVSTGYVHADIMEPAGKLAGTGMVRIDRDTPTEAEWMADLAKRDV